MPELPEILHLKRSLEPLLDGAHVSRVQLRRPEIARGFDPDRPRAAPRHLLQGATIQCLARHGKQLAIVSSTGRAVCVHLGMSGQLWHCPAHTRLRRRDHVHCIWHLRSPVGPGRLVFRDPRRFGGLWCFASMEALRAARWSPLGPDALAVAPKVLDERLGRTRRSLKTALLDQRVLAGIGNIYADEILFAARLDPRSVSSAIPSQRRRDLVRVIRRVLTRAAVAGGSTIRDYVDANGQAGTFAQDHCVYGRASQPCLRCGRRLQAFRLAGRSTVYCASCQDCFLTS